MLFKAKTSKTIELGIKKLFGFLTPAPWIVVIMMAERAAG